MVEMATILSCGPVACLGRENEEIPICLPLEQILLRPVLDGTEFIHPTEERTHIVRILTLVPEGLGVLRRSLAYTVYPDSPLSRFGSLNNIQNDLGNLNRALDERGYKIYNPTVDPTYNDLNVNIEARYCLTGINQPVKFTDQTFKPSEPELAQRAASKDPEAFAELYQKNSSRIYGYVLYRLGNRTIAEEITSDVFSRAWEKIDTYKWEGKPFTHWLLRIATNLVIDHWRAMEKRPTFYFDERFDLVADNKVDPVEFSERASEIEFLKKALLKLPSEQSEVLILRFFEGYDHRDVASILGKSVVATRQIQTRALIAMRKLMGQEGYIPD